MQEGHTNVYTAFHSYNPRAKTRVVISCSLTWFFTYKVSAAVHSSHVSPTSMSRFERLSWQLLLGCEFPRDSRSSIHAPLSPTHCHSLVLCPRVFLKGPQLQKGPQLHNSRKAHNSLRSVIFPACLDEDYIIISPGSSFCFIWRLWVSQVSVLCRMFQNETVDSKHGSAINDPSGSCWRHPTRPTYVTLVCPCVPSLLQQTCGHQETFITTSFIWFPWWQGLSWRSTLQLNYRMVLSWDYGIYNCNLQVIVVTRLAPPPRGKVHINSGKKGERERKEGTRMLCRNRITLTQSPFQEGNKK